MELRQLEYFQMASRLKNITRAAERLNVSQPNITVSIKKLERELGIQLFDRKQKQLELTPEGAIFLNRVNQALNNLRDAVMEIDDYKDLQKGSIKIGIPSMIGAYLFPKIFSSFKDKYPHLDVYLYEEGSMAIREKIEKDELDFGIAIISNVGNSLDTLTMAQAKIVACVSEKNILARSSVINVNDLAESNIIMLRKGSFLRYTVLNSMKQSGVRANIVLESNQIDTIKGLVAQDVGLTFLLDFVAQGTPGIKVLPFEPASIPLELGLVWKKDRYISKASQRFIEFCQDALRTHSL